MSPARLGLDATAATAEVRSLARPLVGAADLTPLVDRVGAARVVCLGESSHGTHEYYRWRALLSRRLIEERAFNWIGVEGDWPDCWRINRWVRGHDDQDLDVDALLARFGRWPTWMWANREVADFLGWLEVNSPDAIPTAMRAWQCFVPYREDPHAYAWSTRLVPQSCETDVVALLVEVRNRTRAREHDDEGSFDAAQNAEVAADAEHYYRTMVRGDRKSWNIRDHHMADTIDRLADHFGPRSKGLVWEHNSHVGDARATDMARGGLVNVGQLVRERYGPDDVALVGFASHRGSVIAAAAWGAPERVLPVPEAHEGSHEDLLHRALGRDAVMVFGDDRSGPWLSAWLGHRAIGVVYQPAREAANYVPTRMGGRYDALVWFERTAALRPLHHEPRPVEPEFETEPSGF